MKVVGRYIIWIKASSSWNLDFILFAFPRRIHITNLVASTLNFLFYLNSWHLPDVDSQDMHMIGCSHLVGTSQGQSIDAWQEVGHPFQLTPLHSVVHLKQLTFFCFLTLCICRICVRSHKGHIKKCCLRSLVWVNVLFNFFDSMDAAEKAKSPSVEKNSFQVTSQFSDPVGG